MSDRLIRYTLDGIKLTHDISFGVTDDDGFDVYINRAKLDKDLDYDVIGSVDELRKGDGKITLKAAHAASDVLLILSDTLARRVTNFAKAARFEEAEIDNEFDNLLRLLEDAALNLQSTPYFSPPDIGLVNGELPPLIAGGVLRVNEHKNGFELVELDKAPEFLEVLRKCTEQANRSESEADKSESEADRAQRIANSLGIAPSGDYKGLWPDSGGNAKEGDTWQTQMSNKPTGQYFAALKDTNVNPVNDDVNWREVVSARGLSKYTKISYKSVSDMLAGTPIAAKVGDRCTTGGTEWERVAGNGDIRDFKELTPVLVDDYGAKGDALISRVKPLYHAINGLNDITNPSATDDTLAIDSAIQNHAHICFSGERGYLMSEVVTFSKPNVKVKGSGVVIVYRGGRSAGLEQDGPIGLFSPLGSVNTAKSMATVVGPVETFSDRVTVSTASNTLKVGDWFLFKASNGASDFNNEIRKYAYYPSQVVALDDVGGGNTSIQMSYKSGFDFEASEVTLGEFLPVENFEMDGFSFIDEMAATPTPDILPVPQAPESERREAVGLIYARNVVNPTITNIKGYNGLYPCVTVYTTNDAVVDNVRNFKPRWFGGGEGYCVRAVTSAYLKTSNLSMLGGRHVVDWTTCAWFEHDAGNGSSDQVSFSLHTQCEHDGVIKNVSGGDFYMANIAFGNVTTRITLDNCNFQKFRANCLHLTIKNSQINDFDATCGKVSIKNTNITEFKELNRERRSGYSDTLKYAQYGKVSIDSDSNISRAKDYTAGTYLKDWLYVESYNRWTSDLGDARPSIIMNDCINVKLKGNLRETLVLFTGALLSFNSSGLTAKWSDGSSAQNLIGINSINVNASNIQRWRLTNMDLELQPNCRPFQIVGRSDSVQPYKAVVVVGGNTFTNCNQATVSDKSANNMLEIVSMSVTRDAYDNGLETQTETKQDKARYAVNEVAYNKGSSGNPAVWNGVSWVDLT